MEVLKQFIVLFLAGVAVVVIFSLIYLGAEQFCATALDHQTCIAAILF